MENILGDFLGNDGSAMAGRQLLTFQQLEGLSLGFAANTIFGSREWPKTRRVQGGGRNSPSL
ncbi:MAG: hypothetical protein E5X86_23415 [Mesorhizobium sp.]|uniref:hypothetical protein n=1 Tax=Mesorhizobium sp. TaxID=1871066 RepID=UPI000FE9E158|nr:hypothetical protein [Mesorhizobium sp.]RWH81201.1 MAG: hypothetical protein EOQ85_09185 [Mesorhizobium sp.]RWH99765.1 MAG: hypothetical protein EOQ88_10365 [Mesorhizobium sp.]RWI22457.1 MAG: hypothetical protein EOQ91_09575 [Mesorhizobium sp.]RWM87330.1 MAG: hypothetical protein EOR83_04780 [Mesorhizobium sp.]TIO14778.1 MAG: hypothetical protein E5X86_23415 [Mesorhizobium sp.]